MNQDILNLKPVFSILYGKDPAILEQQEKRYNALKALYQEKFNEEVLQYFSTPGRTEIGGNHTDHNHGRVLAGSINLDSIAVAAINHTDQIKMYSVGYNEPFEVDLGKLEASKEEYGTTTSLIRGIAFRLKQLGFEIGGFNACIASDVLPGSGLSSSASIEVLIGNIFSSLFNGDGIQHEVLALTGQYAENNFFGKPCGLMDQVACAMGGIVTIDFKNPQDPIIRKVDFDFDAQDYSLVVVDTGGNHADLTDDYASVPLEMKSVAEAMGGSVCRDLSLDELVTGMKDLREKTGDRALLRALHFLGDNERVVEQVRALETDDFNLFLELITESGNSSFKRLQNIYTTKNVEEQGVSLALALSENYLKEINAGACRVHGGGFAGTIQVFLPNSAVQKYSDYIESILGDGSVHVLRIRQQGTLHLNQLNL